MKFARNRSKRERKQVALPSRYGLSTTESPVLAPHLPSSGQYDSDTDCTYLGTVAGRSRSKEEDGGERVRRLQLLDALQLPGHT